MFLQTFSLSLLPLGLCAHCCPHQGICMLFPREDLPLQVWDRSSALVLLWLTRTLSSHFWTWGSLLSSWSSSNSGSQVRMERGWEGGCREWWALGQHCFSCVFVPMLDARLALSKGHVMFINMRMRINTEEVRRCSLINTVRYKVWATVHDC